MVTDSVYFIRNPACSNYGNTQAAPAPKKIDHLLQVRSLPASHAGMLCTCEPALPWPFPGAAVLHLMRQQPARCACPPMKKAMSCQRASG